jgi:hypothetical protein
MHRQLPQPQVEQHGRRNLAHPRMGDGALQRARGAEPLAHRPVGAAERSDPVIRADVALLFLGYNLASRAMQQQGVYAHAPDLMRHQVTNVELGAGRGKRPLRVGNQPQPRFEPIGRAVQQLEGSHESPL